MKAALLPDRGVVKVAGDDAEKFLNGLVTADVGASERAVFAALLTPQGKIIADFIVARVAAEDGAGFLIDCPRALAGTLVDRFTLYKLRAKVAVEVARLLKDHKVVPGLAILNIVFVPRKVVGL